MKAFLLAAGVGSRLRPLTDSMPKCMLPIGGRALIDIWLEALDRAGVDEVLVNLHHLPGVVSAYLERRVGPPTVRTVFEPDLLGSAGTLRANQEWIRDEGAFLVCYADNLTDFDLRLLVETHIQSGAIATWALFRSDEPWRCGIVELDERGTVAGFVEKPSAPAGNLANAGLYVFHPAVTDLIQGPLPRDIGYDLLPKLVGASRGVTLEGYFRDIGTPDSYRAAQSEWSSKALRTAG